MKHVVRNSRLPKLISWFFSVRAFSFGPFVFIRDEGDDRLVNHETIHAVQQYELLFIFQWILYVSFWLVGLIRYRDTRRAYQENPFEKEAYANDEDLTYLVNRPFWAWTRYIS